MSGSTAQNTLRHSSSKDRANPELFGKRGFEIGKRGADVYVRPTLWGNRDLVPIQRAASRVGKMVFDNLRGVCKPSVLACWQEADATCGFHRFLRESLRAAEDFDRS